MAGRAVADLAYGLLGPLLEGLAEGALRGDAEEDDEEQRDEPRRADLVARHADDGAGQRRRLHHERGVEVDEAAVLALRVALGEVEQYLRG